MWRVFMSIYLYIIKNCGKQRILHMCLSRCAGVKDDSCLIDALLMRCMLDHQPHMYIVSDDRGLLLLVPA